jgi:indole-3-glycerol phosphate synthase
VTRLELATSSLARKCSTTELHPRKNRSRVVAEAQPRRKSFLPTGFDRLTRPATTLISLVDSRPTNRLAEIIAHKRTTLGPLRARRQELREAALRRDDVRGFAAALTHGAGRTLGLIAEVKRASPSVGLIAEHFDPVQIAEGYAAAGVDAISVLTEERFFQGNLGHLRAVRDSVQLPILRKDFTLEDVQIYEAGAAGADAVLLIVAALEQEVLERLLEVAAACQLDALVEVHTLEELDRALATEAQIIGINNRNLATFEIDLHVTEELSEQVPPGIVLVSESGIRTGEDSRRVRACGADAILVGEALMRSVDVAAHVAELKLG